MHTITYRFLLLFLFLTPGLITAQTKTPTPTPKASSSATLTPSSTPTPTPTLRPAKVVQSILIENERNFTFAPHSNPNTVINILNSAGVRDQMVKRAFSATPLAVSDLAHEMTERPLTQAFQSVQASFPERAVRADTSAPTDRMDRTFHVRFPSAADAQQAERSLLDAKLVERTQIPIQVNAIPPIESTTVIQAASTRPDQSYLNALKIPTNVSSRIRRRPIIAVIDSGVYRDHADLKAAIWKNTAEIPDNGIDDDHNGYVDDYYGANFTCEISSTTCKMSDTLDRFGHGTHVSGIIAGQKASSSGILGAAPQARIIPIKGLDDNGHGQSDWLAAAIVYAANQGADVINGSWGADYFPSYVDTVVHDAILYARASGTVVVLAAGNASQDTGWSIQAKDDAAITVSASEVISPSANSITVALAPFSNFGSEVDMTAPGVNIWSSISCPNKDRAADQCTGGSAQFYAQWNGTSMAAPFITALAGLTIAVAPTLTPDQVRSVIMATAKDIYVQGHDGLSGAGLPDFTAALNYAAAIRTGGKSEPPVAKIIQPALYETINQGLSRQFEFTVSGANLQNYGIQIIHLSTGEIVGTSYHEANTAVSPTFLLDSNLYPTGRYLVKVTATNRDGVTAQETQDFEIRGAGTTTAWLLHYEEFLPDGRKVEVYPSYGVYNAYDHILVVEDVFTPTSVNSPFGSSTGRARRLTATGNFLETSSITELGNQEDSLYGLRFPGSGDFRAFQNYFFPLTFNGLGVVRSEQLFPDSSRYYQRWMGTWNTTPPRGIRIDPESNSIAGHSASFTPHLKLGLAREFVFFKATFEDQNFVRSFYARDAYGGPFVELKSSGREYCIDTPIGNGQYISVLEKQCSGGGPIVTTLIRRYRVNNKNFSKYLDPATLSRLPFDRYPVQTGSMESRLIDVSANFALLINKENPTSSSFELQLLSLSSGSITPITKISPQDLERYSNSDLVTEAPAALIDESSSGVAVYFSETIVPGFYSAGTSTSSASFNSIRRYNVASGAIDELEMASQVTYKNFYLQKGQVFTQRQKLRLQDSRLLRISP